MIIIRWWKDEQDRREWVIANSPEMAKRRCRAKRYLVRKVARHMVSQIDSRVVLNILESTGITREEARKQVGAIITLDW
jgi:hypothetical protein